MNTFNVYQQYNIDLAGAENCYVWDTEGNRYLDLYGGHAVISIGHCHPHYTNAVAQQLKTIPFYSNAVTIPLQQRLAEKLGHMSGYEDYSLFLCNSGAEANENALKLASFHNGRKKIIAFNGAFHGRTSLAVAATDDRSIQALVNQDADITFLPLNDIAALEEQIDGTTCAVIVEGIQGVGGIRVAEDSFLQKIRTLCDRHGAIFIADEIQSGYGRTGKFFAHQYAGIRPDLITVAKGMGNGFPIGAVLISPKFEAKYSLLGTTFGGGYLACAAALAVLEVMEEERLVQSAATVGAYLIDRLAAIPEVKEIRGKGLMIGVELDNASGIRNELLRSARIFTGTARNTIRLLPPLSLSREQADHFIDIFKQVIKESQ